jgi:MATE family multidrug resistance protein
MAVVVGVPLSVLLFLTVGRWFPYLTSDPAVAKIGGAYMRARVLSVVAVGVNFAFRGYWNGISRSRQYMITLTAMNVLNILLNYVLIFGKWGFPRMEAVGAGLASCIATFAGSGLYLIMGLRGARANGFARCMPDRAVFVSLLKRAGPNSIQQLFYAAGVTALFWIVGRVGTVEMAAANIIITMYLFGVMPSMGLGIAAASLVGQALGRRNPEDAYRWGWDVTILTVGLMTVVALPMVIFPAAMLRLFTTSEEVIAAGTWALALAWLGMPIQSVGLVLMQALMGAGANTRVMCVSVCCQWGVLLPGAWMAGPVWGFGLTGIWLVQLFYRTLQSTLLAASWRQGGWRTIEV